MTHAVAYYNEHDPVAAEWLRRLIVAGHIAPGDVDERSIEDVAPAELAGYAQCHFFAGIGIWSYALRRAGWPDDREIWTGSCPCQPFSAAGKGAGFADERHLWPSFDWLIRQRRPVVIVGEQVASKDGLAWLDVVATDLEAASYRFGAVDTCSAGFGAPHIRQRFYWMADADDAGQRKQRGARLCADGHASQRHDVDGRSATRGMDNAERAGPQGHRQGLAAASGRDSTFRSASAASEPRGVDNLLCHGWREGRHDHVAHDGIFANPAESASGPGPTNGFWRATDWLACRDGNWRPVEPGTFPLAHGIAGRVGRLRAYGNGLNAAQAQSFIEAIMMELA